MYSSIPISSRRIGIFCRMLLSTTYRISLLVGLWCDKIFFPDQNYLHHGRCNVFIFLHFWDGIVWIIHHDALIIFVFEKVTRIVVKDTSLGHLKCWSVWAMSGKFIPIFTFNKSLDGVSKPIRLTGFWIPPLVYTRQDLNIHGVHQSCWCIFLLHCIWHMYIFHKEHLWFLTDISCWWKCCMLTDFREGNQFSSITDSSEAARIDIAFVAQ